MLNFAVCDDEPQMAREIADQLADYLAEKQIASYNIAVFADGRSLLASGENYDLIFLDIQMARPDGMETAKMLRRRGRKPALLVFVTVLRECVFDAFEVQAYDYLVKPLDKARFRRTMERALGDLAPQGLIIQRGVDCEFVPLAQIVYCEVQGRKIYLHMNNGQIIDFYEKLAVWEQRVNDCAGGCFFKCHRSYLVNLDYVRGCQGGRLRLAGGEEIPVSRLREEEMRQAILRHMKKRKF